MKRVDDGSRRVRPGPQDEARSTEIRSAKVVRRGRCKPSTRKLSGSLAALLAGAALASAPMPAIALDVEPLPKSWKEQATEVFHVALDVAVLRPGGLARLTIGSLLMVPSTVFNVMGLPFGRDPDVFKEDAERFVLEPARFTFDRPVGKELAGY